MEPFVLFGSSFPKDKEYTQVCVCVCVRAPLLTCSQYMYMYVYLIYLTHSQVCRNINQIKICAETGRTVILFNLENLYESLYDLLNQVCVCPCLLVC